MRVRHLPPPELGPILRDARLARGWSLRRAAREVGTVWGYVGQLERGERCPSVTMAELLVDAYGLTDWEAALIRSVAVPDVGRDHRWPKAG